MSLTLRGIKGSALTHAELDNNLVWLKSRDIVDANLVGTNLVLTKDDTATFNVDLSSIISGNTPIDIVYSDLYNKTVNSDLSAGQWYRVTDYKSVNFLNGWDLANSNPIPTDPNFAPREIYTGDTEVILVKAISSYEIAQIGYSGTFQGDVIQYQPYTNKIGVDLDIYNGQTLPDSSIVSGFDLLWDGTNVYFDMPTGYPALFGHYFYLYAEFYDGIDYYQDGVFEPLTPVIANCQYPYTSDDVDYNYPKKMSRLSVSADGMKVILLDLIQSDVTNYILDTLEVQTVYAIGDAYGWITKRNDTERNIVAPLDFRGRKYRRFEVDLTPVNPSLGTGYYGQGDDYLGQVTGLTGNFNDFKVFGNDGYDTYNIEWNDMGGADMGWYCGYNDNVLFLSSCFGNKIGAYCRNNTTGNFYSNTIGDSFYSNTIGDLIFNRIGNSFGSNTIGNSFGANIIGNSFGSNTIGNNFYSNPSIGNGFGANIIGDYFSYNPSIGNDFQNNTIGNTFQNNTIGNSFYSNPSIGNTFQNNTIENNFVNNTIGNTFSFNTIGNGFGANIIGNTFQNNTIGYDFQGNTIGDYFKRNIIDYSPTFTNFTSATYVYGDYNCTIFKNSGGTLRLSFYDTLDTLTITGITN